MTAPRHLQNDTVHIVIPDTQNKYGAPTAHLEWAGHYIGEKFVGRPNVKLIQLMDWYDMPSLSSYDRKGGTLMEGRRYKTDVKYGNDAWDTFHGALQEGANSVNLAPADRSKLWFPEAHATMGNHEERIVRAAQQDAQLEGLVTLDDLAVTHDDRYKVHPFLKPVTLDGVMYAHYFANRMSGRPLAGQSMDARIKTIGRSFTMGHQQGLWFGRREIVGGGAHLGLVAGSFYIHDEDYLGHQGNDHWRGIVIAYDVRRGDYDPKFVSLNSLCKRYTGRSIGVFKGRH
jgi:hypothetical protein